MPLELIIITYSTFNSYNSTNKEVLKPPIKQRGSLKYKINKKVITTKKQRWSD